MMFARDIDHENSLLMPITQQNRQLAQGFAREQTTSAKARQVYRNTLAVTIICDYLDMLGFTLNLTNSDCWNPVIRMMADVADLEISRIGRLECRPVSPNTITLEVPPEVWKERIGYVVVELEDISEQAHILGFSPTLTAGTLPIKDLHPLEALIDHLHGLMSNSLDNLVVDIGTHLSQWFMGRIEAGWQQVDALFSADAFEPALAFRSNLEITDATVPPEPLSADTLRRLKTIDLEMQLGKSTIALIVEIHRETAQRFQISLQVHPIPDPYLPPHLTLTILDEAGAEFMQAESREIDNYIQLCFTGSLGEKFSIRVAIGEVYIVEKFIL